MTKPDVTLEKTANATTRSGHTVERAAKLSAANVAHEVIALQLSLNSTTGNQYTASEIPTLVKVYEDSKSRPGITTAQFNALVEDQISSDQARASETYRKAMDAILAKADDVL